MRGVTPTRFGPYMLEARLAVGGMAEVFRATDTRGGRLVALKRILPGVAQDEEFLSMFEDEARIASRLEHVHIARTFEIGRIDDRWFIAFEFVEGRDLRAIFDHAAQQGRFLPPKFLLYVFTRICEGLAYAHARRDARGRSIALVHRDVSRRRAPSRESSGT
jgi:serine/threonine protein kinase